MKPNTRRRRIHSVSTKGTLSDPYDGQFSPSKIDAQLPLTRITRALVSRGRLAEAAVVHDSALRRGLRKMREGRVINLSDLIASKEILVVAVRRLDP